jgi:hypothetical protein
VVDTLVSLPHHGRVNWGLVPLTRRSKASPIDSNHRERFRPRARLHNMLWSGTGDSSAISIKIEPTTQWTIAP